MIISKLNLYPCFSKWLEFDNIYVYSDPHFNDDESKALREGYPGDDEQVKRINETVHKRDVFVCLGDCGDLEYVKKIKAGYKVLIMGNHDKGKTNYQRRLERTKAFSSHGISKEEHKIIDLYMTNRMLGKEDRETDASAKEIFDRHSFMEDKDNRLFDEVYEGSLTISKDIVLSHESCADRYHFNIHGHNHSDKELINMLLKRYDADMPMEDYMKNCLETIKEEKLLRLNVCAELINYTPVSLKEIVKSGVLRNAADIHRDCIDRAVEMKKSKKRRA